MRSFTVLVATTQGLFAFAGSGGGGGWAGLGRRRVDALAVSGTRVWAVTGGDTIWAQSPSDGWEVVARLEGPAVNCLAPLGDDLLAGTAGAHLLRVADGVAETVTGFDEAPGRDSWYTPWGGPPDTRWLATTEPGRIWANVHVGGILRSDDGGITWTPTIDMDADVHQVVVHPDHPDRVMAATAHGLASSADAGGTWAFSTEGLHASYQRAVAVAGDWLLVSVATGPGGGRSALYRRPLEDGGRPFERCREGLPEWFAGNLDTGCLAASGAEAIAATADGSVFFSDDSGGHWQPLADGLPPVTAVTLVA